MHKRVWSFILTVCLLLALTPNTAMAATMERTSIVIRETSVTEDQNAQEAPAKQPETMKKQTAAPVAVPSDLEGSGTETDPYRIKDAAQLRRFADAVNGVGGAPNTGICAVLTQNINLSGVCGADTGSWTPIGTNAHPYRGTFDGASFAVSGLYCQKPGGSYAGMFGSNAGIIKNLGVSDGSVSAGSYAGGLCGINKGTITGCYSAASVSGDKYTGGVCGYNYSGATVSVCYNTGTINGGKYVGGICGYNKSTTSDCYNTGTVIGNGTSIGGICGYNRNLVSGCFNTGEVGGGSNYVGSVCGYNHSGSTFVNCYYLITGTEKGNYGTGMTQQQFSSGEVCYALNEGNGGSVVWKQTCGTGLPGFGGKTVYRAQTPKSDGSTVVAYTNDSTKKTVASTAPAPYTAPTYASSGENTGNNSGGHTHVYQEPKWDWKKYESAKAALTCQDCGEEFVLKASIKKEVTEPTCTEDGETVYKASVEKDGITFKDKQVVRERAKGHDKDPKQITSDTPANCTDPEYKLNGITECYKCSSCNKYFKEKACKNEILKSKVEGPNKATGHILDPTWGSWSSPTSAIPSITVTIACNNNNCTLNEPVTPKVARIYKIPASCAEAGKELYKATATYGGKTFYYDKPGERILDRLTTHNYKGGVCTVCGEKDPSSPSPSTKDTTEDGTLTPGEPLPEAEDPSLLPGVEETPEPPAPDDGQDDAGEAEAPDGSEGTDTPENPDGSDSSGGQDTPENPGGSDSSDGQNTPENPDGSGGTNTPVNPGGSGDSDGSNTPNTSDGSGTPGDTTAPETPDESNGSDGTVIPDATDMTDESIETESTDDIMDLQANASRYGLLYPEGEADRIEENAISLQAAAAGNATMQTGAQQSIPMWGAAIALMLLAGIISLVILQRKHKESE